MVEQLKLKLKQRLNAEQKKKLHRFVARNRYIGLFNSLVFGNNLTKLAVLYGTDKWGFHYYTPHYAAHLNKFRYKKITLLEIGVGGYDDPNKGGNSLRMWKRYFPFGRIFSLDIYDKSPQEERRIKIFRGSQVDTAFLDEMVKEIGPIDVIIDDGSHINEHVIATFKHLFPKLNQKGLYIIEDTQTSYDEHYGGSKDLKSPDTLMNFFKQFPDNLNHKEFLSPDTQPDYYDRNVSEIHFYHNMIFIYKDKNQGNS